MMMNKLMTTSLVATLLAAPGVVLAADVSATDTSFLKKAAQSDIYEMRGSNMAIKKSKNAEVQKFAKEMIEGHSKTTQEIKTLAQKKKVELPTEPNFMQKGSLMLLDTYDAKNFDEEYAENVGVDAHEQAVALFEKAAEDSKDPDIKQFAAKTLPDLKHHHEMAKKLDEMTD